MYNAHARLLGHIQYFFNKTIIMHSSKNCTIAAKCVIHQIL
jgi:hypothetical protein